MTRSPSLRVASGLGCQRCSYILDIRSCRCCQPRFGLYQRSYHETILGIYHTQRRTYIENRINLHDYTCKNAQVVTNLQQICSNAVPTTCQHDVFALLVPQLVDNLLQGCWAQQTFVTSCSNNLSSSYNSSICQQVVSDNLVAIW
jgi:hypothetical protein